MNAFDFRGARVDLGLTQRELAAECGVSLTVIQRLEHGGFANPRNAKKVADRLGVAATDLLPADDRKAA